MYLIVGLGNPGNRYQSTRHNAGFLVVDRLAARWGCSVDKKQLGALVGKARIGNQSVVFAKPQSFMNRSGHPVASLLGYYKVAPAKLIVIHDELDLDLGRVKLKLGGGHGGHNGIRDIKAQLGKRDFSRVRFGISRAPSGWDTADYVLGKWAANEKSLVEETLDYAADAVEGIVGEGLPAAMNRFNTNSESTDSLTSSQRVPSMNPAGNSVLITTTFGHVLPQGV
jgi:peptidyl-tRNA hydrolase, PTH1 family